MHEATSRPRRMRYSHEARCRDAGASRAGGYRWLKRYRSGGWAGLRERTSTPLPRRPRSWLRASAAARDRSRLARG